MPTAAAAAPVSWKSMFAAALMAGVAFVALSIPRFVAVEVVELRLAASRQRSIVAVMRIKPVVHVPIEPARPVEPGTGAKKHPAIKPIRTVVAISGAVIRRIVEVPIRAHRSYANADADLSRRLGCRAQQSRCQSRERKNFSVEHDFSFTC